MRTLRVLTDSFRIERAEDYAPLNRMPLQLLWACLSNVFLTGQKKKKKKKNSQSLGGFNRTHSIAFLNQCFLGATNGGSDGRVFFMLDSIDDSIELLQRRVEVVEGADGFDLEHDSHFVGSQR